MKMDKIGVCLQTTWNGNGQNENGYGNGQMYVQVKYSFWKYININMCLDKNHFKMFPL